MRFFQREKMHDGQQVAAMQDTLLISQAIDEYRGWRIAFEAQLRNVQASQWTAEIFRMERSAFGRALQGPLSQRFARHAAYPDLAEAFAELLSCASGMQAMALSARRAEAVKYLQEGTYAGLCRRVQRALISMQKPQDAEPMTVPPGLRAA